MAARQEHDAGRSGAADGRSTRWAAHRVRRREQLIDAALAVLEEDGPEFGLQQVAARAGVTKPVIYRHFGDRAALVEAMGDRATNLLMARLMPAMFAERPLLERIRLTIEAFLGFIDESPRIYRFFARRVPAEGRDVAGVDKAFVAEALTSLMREYVLPFDPAAARLAPVWAHGTVGFVQNAAEWWLDSRAVSRDELADNLTALLWAQVDGIARRHGVVLDPHQPLTVEGIASLLGRRP
ncbi:TetR/AcrR family transcriptional regulator [Pseudonocardia sp. CA-107938]|uniref:TetR/AcrR family transcriptional regulator n=1 Tax=Pseudonocardia sp. CA-107938 TaxID=3240021 RepID=UPI003D8D22B6